jgi:nitrogen-specific signal transduction histidine kinase/CheY-like chemotaxis protein
VSLDGEGSPAYVSGTCQDVTEARRTQEESFARQKLESIGTLASGIAHDFNNLLGGVLAQAELAQGECVAGRYPDEQLRSIRDVAIRGSEIVRQLMIYAGKERDVPERIDVSKAVKDMMGLLKTTVSRQVPLITDLGESLPAVKARGSQIGQIVMNLVANASDAVKDSGGVIRLSTRKIVVSPGNGAPPPGLPPGDYVQLEVSDTGSGMSQETLVRIFDPFFSTKSAGRGLGLAVVHGIVRNLQGDIRVFSELGEGSTFRILLPGSGAATAVASTDPADGLDRGMAQDAVPVRQATVLVVEDEDPLRAAVGKMLDRAGFGVLEAANGSAAIECLRARAEGIDLLLLDMTIPGAPSGEVLAEAIQARADLKILLMSAYSEDMVRAQLDAPQIRGFVRKPFRLGDLVGALRHALSS